MEQYDIVIVGGGMVGATFGCSMANTQLRIAIIEAQPPAPFAEEQPFDLRVSALSIASQNILTAIGAWDNIANKRLCPYKRMRIWEDQGDTEFHSADIDQPALGYIVENRLIQLALHERIRESANIDLLCPAQCQQIRYDPEGSSLVLEDGRMLGARLLVAGDGGPSKVRQAAAIGSFDLDYPQHALVLSVDTAYSQQDITWQRFVPAGPQAFLPLPGSHASLVWYNHPDEVRRLRALTDAELLTELEKTYPPCLGKIRTIAARGSFPLKLHHASEYVRPGVALIGDAAHVIHPLAGQGVNIGLLDAAALAELIVAADPAAIARLKLLKRYERMRRQEIMLMMTTVDLFYRVFSNHSAPLRVLRNCGLSLAQRLDPAKRKVMRYAMGLDGRLPKLAHGEPLA